MNSSIGLRLSNVYTPQMHKTRLKLPSQRALEPALVAQARSGDAAALGRLFDALVDGVYRYAMLRMRNRDEAERVTEAVLMTLPRALQRRGWASVSALEAYFRLQVDRQIAIARSPAASRPLAFLDSLTRRAVIAGLSMYTLFLAVSQLA